MFCRIFSIRQQPPPTPTSTSVLIYCIYIYVEYKTSMYIFICVYIYLLVDLHNTYKFIKVYVYMNVNKLNKVYVLWPSYSYLLAKIMRIFFFFLPIWGHCLEDCLVKMNVESVGSGAPSSLKLWLVICLCMPMGSYQWVSASSPFHSDNLTGKRTNRTIISIIYQAVQRMFAYSLAFKKL